MNWDFAVEDCAEENELDVAEEAKAPLPPADYQAIGKYFPLPAFRPGQEEIVAIIEKFLAGDRRFLILECPTGTGKSPLALMVGRAAKSSYLVTANKLLQEQYLRDFDDFLADLRGRSNYRCLTHPGYNCDDSPCGNKPRDRQECNRLAACEYHRELRIAKEAPITSFNVAAYLNYKNFVHGFQDRNALIIDEAHNLPTLVSNFVEITLRSADIQGLGLAPEIPLYRDIKLYENFIEELVTELRPIMKKIEKGTSSLDAGQDRTATALDSSLRNFLKIIRKSGIDNFVHIPDLVGSRLKSLVFRPVVVADFANQYCFHRMPKVIMLSATILDPRTFTELLGIEEQEFEFHSFPSTFPVENRPILTGFARTALNRHNLESELPRLAELVGRIIAHYPDSRGIIHGTTYKICDFIAQQLGSERILYPRRAAEQKEILERHRESRNTVLLSPSMNEGVDLSDEDSRFQIIVKVPYPNLGDPVVAKRKEKYPGYYDMQTALTIVQASGRSVRSATDFAHTYVLDGAFVPFVQRNSHIFPRWFLEAIR